MTFALDIKTAEDKAAEALAAAKTAAKQECGRRIVAVLSEAAQINLTAAAAAGQMSDADSATWRAGLDWIAQMRGTWQPLTEAGLDPSDDSNWPPAPTGLAELISRF